jgi:hypothetical protein
MFTRFECSFHLHSFRVWLLSSLVSSVVFIFTRFECGFTLVISTKHWSINTTITQNIAICIDSKDSVRIPPASSTDISLLIYTRSEWRRLFYTRFEWRRLIYTRFEWKRLIYTRFERRRLIYTRFEWSRLIYTRFEWRRLIYTRFECIFTAQYSAYTLFLLQQIPLIQ